MATSGLLPTKVVYIEGNIGSGKSYFLKQFDRIMKKHISLPTHAVFPEPLHVWTSFGDDGTNYLEKMYTNPEENSFKFQSLALTSKLAEVRYEKDKINVVERSIDAQKRVFIPLLYEQGKITKEDRDLLFYMCDTVSEHFEIIDLVVYLDELPETCFRRVNMRDRPEERGVSLTYLEDLKRHYDNYMDFLDVPCLRVKPFYDPEFVVQQILNLLDIDIRVYVPRNDSSDSDSENSHERGNGLGSFSLVHVQKRSSNDLDDDEKVSQDDSSRTISQKVMKREADFLASYKEVSSIIHPNDSGSSFEQDSEEESEGVHANSQTSTIIIEVSKL